MCAGPLEFALGWSGRSVDTVPDVIGLTGRRPGAAGVRVLQGRDARSVRALILDPRGLERGFHDVTIVDMGTYLNRRCL